MRRQQVDLAKPLVRGLRGKQLTARANQADAWKPNFGEWKATELLVI